MSTLTASEIAELDRRIAVMQAYRDGRKIQARLLSYGMDWVDLNEAPAWGWQASDYRIAPEPRKEREFWIVQYQDNSTYGNGNKVIKLATFTDSHNAATFSRQIVDSLKIIHVREVLPEDK